MCVCVHVHHAIHEQTYVVGVTVADVFEIDVAGLCTPVEFDLEQRASAGRVARGPDDGPFGTHGDAVDLVTERAQLHSNAANDREGIDGAVHRVVARNDLRSCIAKP